MTNSMCDEIKGEARGEMEVKKLRSVTCLIIYIYIHTVMMGGSNGKLYNVAVSNYEI